MSRILQPSLTVSYYVTVSVAQKYSCRVKPVEEVFTSSFIFEEGGIKAVKSQHQWHSYLYYCYKINEFNQVKLRQQEYKKKKKTKELI